jgi:hypothetical protein
MSRNVKDAANQADAWCVPHCLLFLTCLVCFLCASAIGWQNTILDGDHGFRQTQTAISAAAMVGQPPKLAYDTPVLGPPWSIPFEFPIYQWTVAGLVTVFHRPLAPTGRAVGVAFFLMTLVPAWCLLRACGFGKGSGLVILAMLLASPFYVFWSRTFMIESTALFFTTSYALVPVPAINGAEWVQVTPGYNPGRAYRRANRRDPLLLGRLVDLFRR